MHPFFGGSLQGSSFFFLSACKRLQVLGYDNGDRYGAA